MHDQPLSLFLMRTPASRYLDELTIVEDEVSLDFEIDSRLLLG